MNSRFQTPAIMVFAKRSMWTFWVASLPRKWSILNTWSSSNTWCTSTSSLRKLSSDVPYGFS